MLTVDNSFVSFFATLLSPFSMKKRRQQRTSLWVAARRGKVANAAVTGVKRRILSSIFKFRIRTRTTTTKPTQTGHGRRFSDFDPLSNYILSVWRHVAVQRTSETYSPWHLPQKSFLRRSSLMAYVGISRVQQPAPLCTATRIRMPWILPRNPFRI